MNEEQIKEFTITVFSENIPGLLMRVVTVFTRRHINIESLTTSKSSLEGINRFTIVVHVPEKQVKVLIQQLEKQVDIIKAFYYHPEEMVYNEIALYKIPTSVFANNDRVEKLIRKHNARILAIEPEYIVVEKTGHEQETESLLHDFENYGIYEFVRSGRVAITKHMEPLNAYLRTVASSNGSRND